MADSICTRCFHNYVCEQFNEDRDYKNKECRYLNSHFVDVDSVEPVRHGHWEYVDTLLLQTYHRCSECGNVTGDYVINKQTFQHDKLYYCPYCGAKMDEVKE